MDEYWNGVGNKEQRHAVESAGLLCDQSEECKCKTPPTGNSWRLCEGWRWPGLEEESVFMCIGVTVSVAMGLSLSAYQTSILCDPGIKTRTPGSNVLGQAAPLLPCPMVNAQGIETPAL